MKHKKILIAAILLLAILTVGAVSASEDADALAQESDALAQDADVLAQESNEIVGQDNAIDEEISSFDDESEGNFTFSMDPISTTSGETAFATLNLPEATEGIVLVTTENETLFYEKYVYANEFYQSSEGYSFDLLFKYVDFDDLNQGKQFLNFRFYDCNHNPLIHEYYQVDYNKGSNMLVISPEIYLEIYDGLISFDSEDPIIVAYAPTQTSKYALTITDEDNTWGYYPDDLTWLVQFNSGLYTKNHMEGWAYYGISSLILEDNGLDSSLDGKTLDISIRKVNNGNYGDWMAQEERTITFEYNGFYLEEDAVNPTLILEIYGNEYMPIDYNNGEVFAIIVSGDERTGKWLPVDKLIPVTLRVLSDDGEIEFLNVTLGSLDYNASGSMGIIEHFFTLSDLNNFSGLNDGDLIRFALRVPPFPERYMYYTIHFEQEAILLTSNNNEGGVWLNVCDKAKKDDYEAPVFGVNISNALLTYDLRNGIVEITSDDGQVLYKSKNTFYNSICYRAGEDRWIIWYYVGDVVYHCFDDLESGDIININIMQFDGAFDPWLQKRYRFTEDHKYFYLEEYEDENGGNAQAINTTITVPKVTADYNSGKNITATLKDVDGNVIKGAQVKVVVGNITKTLTTNSNGQVSLSINGLVPKTYTATVTYAGNGTFAASSTTAKVIIKKLATTLSASNVNTYYNSGKYLLVLLKDANGNPIKGATVNVDYGSSASLVTDANGKARLVMDSTILPVSTTAKISFAGDSIYTASNTTSKFVVSKLDTKLTVSSSVSSTYNGGKYVLAVLKDANGNPIKGARIAFVLNKKSNYLVSDAKGCARFSTNGLKEGSYDVKVGYFGNATYKASNQPTSKVTISRIATQLSVSGSISATPNSGKSVLVILKDANGKTIKGAKVAFVVNNKATYVATDANGRARFSIGSFKEGSYDVKVGYFGNDTYKASNQGTCKVTIKKIATQLSISKNVNARYRAGGYVLAILKDASGKVIKGAKICFVGNGKTTYVLTDANGKARLSVDGYRIGTTTVQVGFFGTDIYKASDIQTSTVTIKLLSG